jgi:hypothetical protein
MSDPSRTPAAQPGRLNLSISQVMRSIAAVAVLLAALFTLGRTDTILVPVLAFLVLTNLVLRLYYVLWPTVGPVLLGFGGPDSDPDEDEPRVGKADDPDFEPIRDDLGFPQP